MSEDKGKDLGWETFSATPKIVDAVQYLVLEKDGKKFSNFLKIIKRPNINGRVSQQIDHMSVHTNAGRVQLRSGSWLVIDAVGDLHVYKDEDFQKLFEAGSDVSTDSGAQATDLTEIVEKRLSEAEKEWKKVYAEQAKEFSKEWKKACEEMIFGSVEDLKKEFPDIFKKESKNVKSKSSKS